jgi:hypothetical protein
MTAEEAILTLVAARGVEKSICPTEAARALDEGAWRRRLPEVRRAAIALAKAGRIAILRKGKPANPDDFKGVYRLRALGDGDA